MVICTKDDADKIFAPLADYTVEIEGHIVTDTLEMNQKYYDFDTWIIKRKDGSLVSKKALKSEIEKIKVKDIESNWSAKYENKWGLVVTDLESIILTSKSESMTAIHREYLMKFFIALDWRSIQSNDEFQKALHDPKLRAELLATKKASQPFAAFCSKCRELGYEIYDMDLITAGEEAYAAMRRSTNGGGENSPMLEGEDDLYELFFAGL